MFPGLLPLMALAALAAACHVPASEAPFDGAALVVSPRFEHAARRLMTAPYTAASIDHVDVALYAMAGATETLKASQEVAGAQVAAATVTFTSLRRNTTYRIKATAYRTAGTADPISDAASSQVDVAVGTDDRPTFTGVPIKLIDQDLSGFRGTSAGIDVTPGVYVARGSVTTFAGDGLRGWRDGVGTAAQFRTLTGLAVDPAGTVYITDMNNHSIRKATPAGAVTTLAGVGVPSPGPASTGDFADDPDGTIGNSVARFRYPRGVALDEAGNVYVADAGNNRIRKITPTGGVTTLAGTGAVGHDDDPAGTSATTAATFDQLRGIAVDRNGNLFVTEVTSNTIRKITPEGAVTTFVGTGVAGADDDPEGTSATTAATFNGPRGLAFDPAGNLYVADFNNHRIRKVTPAGAVTTLAGSVAGYQDDPEGAGTALFDGPFVLAVDASGNVFVSDFNNNRIRKVSAGGRVTTVAGTGAVGATDDPDGVSATTTATFRKPAGIAVDANGNVYLGDNDNYRVRVIR